MDGTLSGATTEHESDGNEGLLRIPQSPGITGTSVALCGWAAKADDSIVCFGAKPDKGFLDMKSRRIRKWEGDAREAVDGGPGRGS